MRTLRPLRSPSATRARQVDADSRRETCLPSRRRSSWVRRLRHRSLQQALQRMLEVTGVCDVVPSLSDRAFAVDRSEEHTSELQSLMRISFAVFCLKKKKKKNKHTNRQ